MRIAIIGNSGSGKSTLAKALAASCQAAHLDLDTLAWEPNKVAVPRDLARASQDLYTFCVAHDRFVIEGCYESLMPASFTFEPHLIFLDVPFEVCEVHCRRRPFEPHKYASIEAQNEKLEFLLTWVRDYYTRTGPMSRAAHLQMFDEYAGPKTRFDRAIDIDSVLATVR